MIYIINGPSGTGKTLVGEYLKSKGIRELVSHTTRKPRPGEADGISYHYVTLEEFKAVDKVEESEYAGNHYGVSKAEVAHKYQSGDVFAVTDINGTKSFRRIYKDKVRVIFVDSSPRFLRERMKARGDSKESIRKRIDTYREYKEKKNRLFADFIVENNSSVKRLRRRIDLVLKRHRGQHKKNHQAKCL